jgi:hypothetical protein
VQPAAAPPAPVYAPPAPAPAPSIPASFVAERDAQAKRLAELEAKLAERTKGDDDVKATLAALNEKLQLTEREKKQLAEQRRDERIIAELKVAALRHGAVDEEDLVALVRNHLTVGEDGRVVAASDPKIDADTFVKSFLERKPHLARPRVAQGSGASPVSPAGVAGTPALDLTTEAGRTEFVRASTLRTLAPRGRS